MPLYSFPFKYKGRFIKITHITTPLKYFLVQKLNISNKEAIDYILKKRITVNKIHPAINQEIYTKDAIELDGIAIKQPENYVYIAYFKPRGIECTLNRKISNNLADALKIHTRVFPVGRLDKESEGLLLLTNDGESFNKILHSNQYQEKEYIITVDKPLTEEAILLMSSGIKILGRTTRPAKIQLIDDCTFQIILTQGINRQIRRMCFKTGYEVTSLKRIRIINVHLHDLAPGEWRNLSKDEISFEL